MDKKEKKMLEAVNKVADGYREELREAGKTIIENIFEKGMQPQEALAIPKSKTESIYAQAYQLYNSGNYEKAYKTFELLSMLNNTEPRYMFGMAASLQGKQEYKDAFLMFMRAASQDQGNPVPYYHASDCCLKLNDKITALVMLTLVIETAKGKPEFDYIRERSAILKDSLTIEINEEGKQLLAKKEG